MSRWLPIALVTIVAMPGVGAAAPKKGHAMSLQWTLTANADRTRLLVDIKFTNRRKAKVYIVDRLVTSAPGNKFARSDRLTVMNTDDPTVAQIVLGAISSDRPSTVIFEPTYAPVAPGATVTRHFELPLPLTSWNPVGGANPLSPQTKKATLTVFGFAGEPERWRTLPSDDPTPLKVPELDRAPLVFEAPALPLP